MLTLKKSVFAEETLFRASTTYFSPYTNLFSLGSCSGVFLKRVLLTRLGLLAACLVLIACLSYTSTIEMKALRSSETSVNFYRTMQCHIPEESTLHDHCY
jgi:hypothetical protein